MPTSSSASITQVLDKLNQLNAIGVALSQERNLNRLLENILVAAQTLTGADGGTLYRTTENATLRFEIIRNNSLAIALGGTGSNEITFPDIPLQTADGSPNNTSVAAYAALHDETINIADAYEADGFDFSGPQAFDRKNGYHSKSFLTIPMKNHQNEIIGVLQLINAQSPDSGEIVPFDESDERLAQSLASQAGIALTNRQLIDQLENLFESFIKLINTAIDEKSPYTGGHCQRVPALTMMLAEAAHKETEGPLRDFHMTERDRYELSIAGLLHDCGKVTTPVHVVDKATKLHTLFDRIALVDTRFEVLKRDAEILLLRQKLEAFSPGASDIKNALAPRLQELDDAREVLRSANAGSESVRPEIIEKIRQIGKYRWHGTDGRECDFLTPDELMNLTILHGTLTEAERGIINHHIVATISMLESLPWPKHLERVPEYAGGHHERMDGKGYPKGLKREEMSIQARIMGIADIFEALTARDRPYKKAMPVEEALNILRKFRDNGHIDPDLFDVFVKHEVHKRYALEYLHQDN